MYGAGGRVRTFTDILYEEPPSTPHTHMCPFIDIVIPRRARSWACPRFSPSDKSEMRDISPEYITQFHPHARPTNEVGASYRRWAKSDQSPTLGGSALRYISAGRWSFDFSPSFHFTRTSGVERLGIVRESGFTPRRKRREKTRTPFATSSDPGMPKLAITAE